MDITKIIKNIKELTRKIIEKSKELALKFKEFIVKTIKGDK